MKKDPVNSDWIFLIYDRFKLMCSAWSTFFMIRSSKRVKCFFKRRLSIVRSCSSKMIESWAIPDSAALILTCVGKVLFVSWAVMAATIVVGL